MTIKKKETVEKKVESATPVTKGITGSAGCKLFGGFKFKQVGDTIVFEGDAGKLTISKEKFDKFSSSSNSVQVTID